MSALAEFSFTIKGIDFKVGLYPTDKIGFPDIYYPALYQKVGTEWIQVDRRDEMWKDIQEDMSPSFMAQLILDDFNKTIKQITGGTQAMTWIQQLAKIFQENLVVSNSILTIKG